MLDDSTQVISAVRATLPETVTLIEAAIITGRSVPTLYRDMNKGTLRFVRVGGSRHIYVSSLRAFMGGNE